MATTDEARHRLYQELERLLGQEHATTLMDHLPPTGWADVATHRDVDILGREVRSEMTQLGGELRSEMAQLGGELRVEMANLRADVAEKLRSQTLVIVGSNVALAAAILGAARFI